MKIVEVTKEKEEICRHILDALPQWFGIEEAKENYIREVGDLVMFGCVSENAVVGFLTLRLHNELSAEVHLIAVLPDYFRKGIGRGLVRRAEEYVLARGLRFLSVKTLSPSRENADYERTRKFYQAVGFVPLMELPNLWGPENPCLLMIKDVCR